MTRKTSGFRRRGENEKCSEIIIIVVVGKYDGEGGSAATESAGAAHIFTSRSAATITAEHNNENRCRATRERCYFYFFPRKFDSKIDSTRRRLRRVYTCRGVV